MLTERRRTQILDTLRQDGVVSIQELSKRFDVSYMTIWRDLEMLAGQGQVQRVRGGAVIAPVEARPAQLTGPLLLTDGDPSADPHYQTKLQIGRYAARTLVEDGDVIIVEAGTTSSSVAPFLEAANLTVLTNGLLTSMMIFPNLRNITLMCSGGVLIETGAFIGPQAEEFFSHYRVKKAFFGAMGCTLENGFTDPTPLYTRLKSAMRQNTEKVIMLLDSSKLGVHSLVQVMALQDVHILVTDAGAPAAYVDGLRQHGIEVHIAHD